MVGYEFECPVCGPEVVLLDPAEDDLLWQVCRRSRRKVRMEPCGLMMRRVFGAVPHNVTFRAGFDGATKRYFGSRRARDNYLAEHGLSLRDPDI